MEHLKGARSSLGLALAALALMPVGACIGAVAEQPAGADEAEQVAIPVPGPNAGETDAGESGPKAQPPTSNPAPEPRVLAPGRAVLRRLNRAEYNNTVADLFGTKLRPATAFPPDNLGGEFTTVGAALSLSPSYVEAYEGAALALAQDVFTDPARTKKIVSCDLAKEGRACAEKVIGALARRAFRRPVRPEEIESLMGPFETAMAQKGLAAPAVEGVKYSIAATLLSPHFLFKVEAAPSEKSVRKLTPHELASRLSYALWATMPDDELSALADEGTLSDDKVYAEQVDRLLRDPRADALLDGFISEWLDFHYMDTPEVDKTAFPKFDAKVAASMKQEAKLFFRDFLREPRPFSEMLTTASTYVDPLLAAHYGLPLPKDATGFTKVDTSSTARRGLFSLGAFLTATSLPSRTSPVKRGDFVAHRLMCVHIPSPPPDIAPLPAEMPGLTMRQRMELHRSSPSCKGCHALMDPIGFGLENFDAVGQFRTMEVGGVIDASGQLPGGAAFSGPSELGAAVAQDDGFMPCVTEKFATYAIGRLLHEDDDEDWKELLSQQAIEGGGTLTSIIRAVLLSDLFRATSLAPSAESELP